MGVQRTSFNHLLSGRNKPGFEFLTRLHACYPSINLNWLISGYGSITESDDHKFSHSEKYESESQSGIDLFSNIFNSSNLQSEPSTMVIDPVHEVKETHKNTSSQPSNEQEIDRLIIIYKDGKMVEVKQ